MAAMSKLYFFNSSDTRAVLRSGAALVSLELKKYNIGIAAISETRLAGNFHLREEKGGNVFFIGWQY